MRRRFVIIAAVALALLLVTAHFIPSYNQQELLIHSPIIRAAQELNTAAEWQRWNPALQKYCADNPNACVVTDNRVQNNFTVQAGQNSFAVAVRGASYDVTETANGNTSTYNYTLASSIYNDTTTLVVTQATNLLSSLLAPNKGNAFAYADSLKNFIETPSSFYGFPLKLSSIVDSLVISTHKVVLNKNSIATLKELYKKLDDFIATNHLQQVRPRIGHFEPKGNDSIDLVVAIPVDKMLPPSTEKNGVAFLQMPVQGHMVFSNYKGPFNGRFKLYQALYKYLNDRLLKPVSGATYEEYLNNAIPENDSSIVNINISIPYL